MQVDRKRDGAAPAVAAGLKEQELETAAASIQALYEIIKDIEADLPFGAIRHAYAAPLDGLVKLAGRRRDVNMLARLHRLISILETEDNGIEQRGFLRGQVAEIEKMLQGWTMVSPPAVNGIIAGPGAEGNAELSPSQRGYLEELLRALPAISDEIVGALREQGLLDEERLLHADAMEIAKITGISPNTAFEIKSLLRSAAEQRVRRDVARRVSELKELNEQLNGECDRLIAVNNTLLAGNRGLKTQYPVVSEQYEQEISNFKTLQSRVVSARLESNRLATEISFLRAEHQKLLDMVEEKHVMLDDLFRRFSSIRTSFEFMHGETGFAEDIMMNVEGLLDRALLQKKSLNDKLASSEESIEKLFSEFNSIVKKGKMEFYRNI